MCGINGFNWEDAALIKEMNLAIKHRGPDDEGKYNDKNMTLGHVRLSIIELSEKGHQPMGLDVKNNQLFKDDQLTNSELTIVFNGEIYNYKEIRKELKGRFNSESDTEVILRAYKKWGTDCVKKFNGMWAFCIHDKRKNILFCSRDRLGVKPFHYYYNPAEKDKNFVFSSELKGIITAKKVNKKENINKEAVELYFSLGYIPSPHTIYKNVYKLEAGHNLLFDLKNKTLKKEKYYELKKYSPIYNKKKLIEEGRNVLFDATRLRMISDVPVGAFLSGGLDSSSVVGAMSKNTKLENLHTFSIGFEKAYDETKYINLVKNYFKTKHHHYYFKEKDFENLIEKYSFMYDEPFGDYSGFPTYKVSELARKNVTVSLSGDGGDEIFGGYTMHQAASIINALKKYPLWLRKAIYSSSPKSRKLGTYGQMQELLRLSLYPETEFRAKLIEGKTYMSESAKKWMIEKIESIHKETKDIKETSIRFDLLYNTLADNFLVKVDRASMQNALEVRSPFLDYRFLELEAKIPSNWKTNITKRKILFRKIIKDLVPNEIVNRKKSGFEPPIRKWINKPKWKSKIDSSADFLYKNKVINKEIKETYDSIKDSEDILHKIFIIRMLAFGEWYKMWVNK